MKALLPQVATPFMPKIDMPGVVPMRFSQGCPQAVFLVGNDDQVRVIGH